MKEIAERSLFTIPENLKRFLWVLVIVGLGMFIAGLTTGGEDSVIRTWQAFLINTVFWAGIAHSGILFSVIWQLTDAKWGRPFKRLSEACAAFLPISFLMFVVVFFGSKVLYEWSHTPFLHHGVAVKAGWLNLPFFVSRNIVWLVIIYAVSWWFVKTSIKPDIALARKLLGSDWGGTFADKILKGYGEHEDELIRLEKLSRKIAPVLAILYAVGASFLAFDFVMTLDQEWFSTLFGVFFIIGNMHAFLGLILAISITVRNKFEMHEYITINRLHDLAKLVFAFSVLVSNLLFAAIHYVTLRWKLVSCIFTFMGLYGLLAVYCYLVCRHARGDTFPCYTINGTTMGFDVLFDNSLCICYSICWPSA